MPEQPFCPNRSHFVAIPSSDGLLLDMAGGPHPTRIYGWGLVDGSLRLESPGAYFGFVADGPATLTSNHAGEPFHCRLLRGMYFCTPGPVELSGGSGTVIAGLDYSAPFMIGGPIEGSGRLRYIDGCTDSLLVPPVLKGDPCLNHLHFPPGIRQTRHTHPSLRAGLIARGQGRCVVPSTDSESPDIEIPLLSGQMFFIPAGGVHSFLTEDEPMDVVTYHPDSDFGPEHDCHPMVNRTMIDGMSASQIGAIRTRPST